jgi:hypothetical protein
MLRLASSVWPATLAHLQKCGGGRRECVAFWLAPQASPDEVDVVVHPDHTATAAHYAPGRAWLDAFWPRLVREGRSVRAQVHTHGGRAWHSKTDDDYPLIHMPGFLSLVVPSFAKRPITEGDLFLAEIGQDGHWRRVGVRDRIEGIF